MSDHESENEEVSDLSSPDVTTKYRTAGDIINKVLAKTVELVIDQADIATICEASDKMLEEEVGKLYNKKVKDRKIEKGIAFPTCVSVNEIVGHYSPFKNESRLLNKGDVAKIDLAIHIDGFIAAAAHTVVVGDDKVDDRRADVVMAAWNAAEAALRLVQVGNTNTMVTETWAKVAKEFKCNPVAGVLSHQLKRHVIDGNQSIISAETPEEKVDEFEFQMNEVYCIDVVMSSGEGKTKEAELRHTVYKRAPETSYSLKTQKARQFLHEVNKRFPVLPFSLRNIEDEQVARVGVSEAKRHELLEEYPVLKEKDKEMVAQFKFTVLLLPGGTKRITGLPLGKLETQLASTCVVEDPELKKLLASSSNPKKKKKASAKKEGGDDKAEKSEAAEEKAEKK